MTVATGAVTSFAGAAVHVPEGRGGTDGTGASARFSVPVGIASDEKGDLYVGDVLNGAIRKVDVATATVTTLAGRPAHPGTVDGTRDAALLDGPMDIASDGAGHLYVAGNNTVRKVSLATGAVTTVAGAPGEQGTVDGTGTAARFDLPLAITVDGVTDLYVGDRAVIRRVDIATGVVSTFAGQTGSMQARDGTGTGASFGAVVGIVSDGAGSLYVADSFLSTCHAIRKIEIATGVVTTIAGSISANPADGGPVDGTGGLASFLGPSALASDGAGNLYINDMYLVRKLEMATGVVTTIAGSSDPSRSADGTGAAASFRRLTGITSDRAGSLFVGDENVVRKVDVKTATVSTVIGSQDRRGVSLGALPASLSVTTGIALLPSGELAIADIAENVVLIAHR